MTILVMVNVMAIYLILIYMSGKRVTTANRRLNNVIGNEGNFIYTAGQTIEGKLDIDINVLIPPPFMLVDETLERHDGTQFSFGGIITTHFSGLTKFRYKIERIPRGVYKYKPISCVSYDAFGLVKLNRTFYYDTVLTVMPQKLPNEQWNHLFRGFLGDNAFITFNPFSKESTQQAGIREYHYGDKISRIHWNATARTGEWKSKDFERESVPRTMVILDACPIQKHDNPRTGVIDASFELAVSTATSLFEFGLKQQSSFGLISNSDEVFVSLPQMGEAHYTEVMNHLTTINCTSKIPLSKFLKQLTIERAFVGYLFIVTNEISEDMLSSFHALKRRGYEPYLLYIPSNENITTEQSAQLDMFRMQGIPVVAVPPAYLQPLSLISGGAVG